MRPVFCALLLALLPAVALGQTVTATLGTGNGPLSVAVNPITNRIYVANSSSNSVTVIDGTTNSTSTVLAGTNPLAIAVNPVTNKIYVANNSNSSTVTVIDGTNNTTSTVGAGRSSSAVAVNPVTNKIYVANQDSGDVTVIDGTTNSTSIVPAGSWPSAVAVNPVTNKIYVANAASNNVTVIDGATNSTTPVPAGNAPYGIAVNPVTNKIYVANTFDKTATVIDGVTNSTSTVAAGTTPYAVAVNPATNTIYVANQSSNDVTVIDGVTNSASTVAAGTMPCAVAVNPVTDKIYVANNDSANVTVIDGDTNSTSSVTTGEHPDAVAVNPVTNKIYVANWNGGNVTVIDGATNSTFTVPTGNGPTAVAVNPVTNKIYVANWNGGNVTVIDGDNNTTSTLTAGGNPCAVAVNPVTNRIYVANFGSNNVTVIDRTTDTTSTVATGTYPIAVAVNPVSNRIYVANRSSNNVTVIDGTNNSTSTVSVESRPVAVAVNPASNKIYVANQDSNSVTVIDGDTNSTSTVTAGDPYAVAVSPVSNKIYVANQGSNSVTVIDGDTNSTSTVAAGTTPYAVAVNPVTNKIYVTNYSSNNVTVIDGATNSTSTIAAGTGPDAIAVNPATNRIYIANRDSNDVTVITPSAAQPIPLANTVSGVSDSRAVTGNEIFSTRNASPSFTAAVTSSYTPTLPPPTALYYQLDTAQGGWKRASAATGSGTNPADYGFSLANVPPGVHTVYLHSAYGNEGTPASNGASGNSPQISNLSAYPFLILPELTTTTVTADVNPQNEGSTVTFTAYVTAEVTTSTLTGTINFFDGVTLLGQSTLDGTGHATYQTSALSAGTHSITASYQGYASYASSTSAALSVAIAGSPASIAVDSGDGQTAEPNHPFGNPLVVLVRDSNGAPVPNVAVTFSGAGLNFSGGGIATTDGNGRTSITATPASGSAGSVTASASVSGVSTPATFSLTVRLLQTISFSLPPTMTYSDPITLSATATSGLPVTYTVILGPATVSGSTLTLTGTGDVVLEASQGGNATWQAATPVSVSVRVNPAALTITASNKVKTYGQALTFAGTEFSASGLVNGDTVPSVTLSSSGAVATAGVSGSPYAIVPSAPVGGGLSNYTITYSNGTLTVDKLSASVTPTAASKTYGAADPALTGTLTGFLPADNVTATFTRTAGEAVASGPYTITAALAPVAALANYDVTYSTAPFAITAAPLAVTATSTGMTYGTAVPPLSGTLSGVLTNDGITATYITTATGASSAGTYAIIPSLNDPLGKLGNYSVGSTNGTLTIHKAGSLLTLQTSAPALLLKNDLALIARAGSSTSGVPTGIVTFFDGTTSIGTAALDATGTASLSVNSLAAGSHNLTASYSGDLNFSGSNSSAVAETVQDFQFVASGSADTPSVVSVTVQSGGTAVYRLQLAPINGSTFAGNLTLTLAGLPAGATYTISPASVAAGSSAQIITVTVQTSRTVGQSRQPRTGSTGTVFACGLLFPFFGMVSLRRPLQKRLKHTTCMLLLAVAVVLAIAGMSGCGAIGSGFASQQPQTHNLTLTGTSGALQRSVGLTLTIR